MQLFTPGQSGELPLGQSDIKKLTWRIPRRHTISIPSPSIDLSDVGDTGHADDLRISPRKSRDDSAGPRPDNAAEAEFSSAVYRATGAVSPSPDKRFQSPKRRALSMMVENRSEFTKLQTEERGEIRYALGSDGHVDEDASVLTVLLLAWTCLANSLPSCRKVDATGGTFCWLLCSLTCTRLQRRLHSRRKVWRHGGRRSKHCLAPRGTHSFSLHNSTDVLLLTSRPRLLRGSPGYAKLVEAIDAVMVGQSVSK